MNRVLWLVSWYPSRVDEFNGDFIQRHARAVAEFCEVEVIYVVKDPHLTVSSFSEEKINGHLKEKVVYYYSPRSGIRLLDRLISHWKYSRLYRKAVAEYIRVNGKPAIVHVHIAMKAGMTARWVKKKWGIPYLVTENWTGYYRQSVPSVYTFNRLFKKMNRVVLRDAALFLPVTNDLGETINRDFVKVSYQVIPNVVNTGLFYYKPIQRDKFRFIHLSYMNYQKNPEGILDAAKRLRERGYDFELVMTGNEDEQLISKVKKDSLLNESVSFHAAVPYPEVAKQMQAASAFILFSRFENLPCVILEALCCGLPVISSKVGGVAEVIDTSNGILVESENTGQLLNAMQHLIDHYQSYDRETIARNASHQFNYTKVGSQIVSCYGW